MPKALGAKTRRLIQVIKSNKSVERRDLLTIYNFTKSDLDARIKVFAKKGWIQINPTFANNDAKNVEYKWIADENIGI